MPRHTSLPTVSATKVIGRLHYSAYIRKNLLRPSNQLILIANRGEKTHSHGYIYINKQVQCTMYRYNRGIEIVEVQKRRTSNRHCRNSSAITPADKTANRKRPDIAANEINLYLQKQMEAVSEANIIRIY